MELHLRRHLRRHRHRHRHLRPTTLAADALGHGGTGNGGLGNGQVVANLDEHRMGDVVLQDLLEVHGLALLLTARREVERGREPHDREVQGPRCTALEAVDPELEATALGAHEAELSVCSSGVRSQGGTAIRDHHDGHGRDSHDRSSHVSLLSQLVPVPKRPPAPSALYLAVAGAKH